MKQTLTLDTVGDVDSGTLRIAMNKALNLITQDLADRPTLKKARKVILQIEMTPVIDTNSSSPEFDHAEVSWQVYSKTPAIGMAGTVMKANKDGQLYFHSDLPESPDDETILDEAERRKLERGERKD